MVKNSPANEEMWVQSLGQEDPLEKEMATHSSIFAWRIPWTEEPVHGATVQGVAVHGVAEAIVHGVAEALDMTEHTCTSLGGLF